MPSVGHMYRPYALPTPQYLPGDVSFEHTKLHQDTSMNLHSSHIPDKLAPLLQSPPTPPPDSRHASDRRDRPLSQRNVSGYGEMQSTAVMAERSAILQTQMALQRRRDQEHSARLRQDDLTWRPVPGPPVSGYARAASPSAFSQHASNPPPSRRVNTGPAIAPALQIPSSVNSSHGSLAELTAQITCLFWFENTDVLEAAEKNTPASYPEPAMSKDAIPTTGFRKFVTTMLSTTQVAQNVVILGLLFIYRLKKHSQVKGRLGSEYRLLTVALMLGNKFLDDNTYTNKTWAEVSGISVTEVHIMEVEFLSNMKYNLYCSAAEWGKWQSLLGRFANFVERAMRTAAMLPTTTLRPVMAAYSPSPPSSAQLSPIYPTPPHFPAATAHGLPVIPTMPAQGNAPQYRYWQGTQANATTGMGLRKRSLEDTEQHAASKRVAYNDRRGQGHERSNSNASSNGSIAGPAQPGQHIHVPIVATQPQGRSASVHATPLQRYQLPHLPPIIIPNTGQPVTYPSAPWPSHPTHPVTTNQSPMYPSQQQQQHSRLDSPYVASRDASPLSQFQHAPYTLHTPNRPSTSAIMYQRDSPYRAVREVSTLLVPPPAQALHQPGTVTKDHLHYQPIGRPVEERQTGRLPYVAQNQWLDGQNGLKTATPIEQWPCFFNGPPVPSQHFHNHRQQPSNGYAPGNGNLSAGRRD